MGVQMEPYPELSDSFWRNCLEIRDRSRIGAPSAAKRGRRSPDSGASCRQRGTVRRLRLFSKQFRKVRSPKFACRSVLETSEVGFSKVQRHDPVGGVPCPALLDAQWHWAPPASVKLSPSTGTNSHS